PANPKIPGATPLAPGNRSASIAFALMAKVPLRFPEVIGPPPVPSLGIVVPGPPTGTPLLLNGKLAEDTAVPVPAVPPEPKTLWFPILNGPSSQSKPS